MTLDPDKRAVNRTEKSSNATRNSRLIECSQCQAIRTAGQPCGHCGFFPKRAGQYVSIREGELAHVDQHGRHQQDTISPARLRQWHAMLTYEGMTRGYKPAWPAVNFKEKFGMWPPREPVNPIPPDPEVASWIRHRRIAFAKRVSHA